MELKNNEKLSLINSMEIIEDSASNGEIEYILVEDNKTNREILHKIGLSDKDIENECWPDEDDKCLDISSVGFKYAQYYSMKKEVFYNEDSSGSPITIKTLEE